MGSLNRNNKNCDISAGEDEWIRDIFINNMKNFDMQRNLLVETFTPLEALSVALIDEKGMENNMRMKNSFKSNGLSVHKLQKTQFMHQLNTKNILSDFLILVVQM